MARVEGRPSGLDLASDMCVDSTLERAHETFQGTMHGMAVERNVKMYERTIKRILAVNQLVCGRLREERGLRLIYEYYSLSN